MVFTEADNLAVMNLVEGNEDALAHLMRRLNPSLLSKGIPFLGRLYEMYRDEWIQDTWMLVWRYRHVFDPSKAHFFFFVKLQAREAARRIRRYGYSGCRIPDSLLLRIDHCTSQADKTKPFEIPSMGTDPIERIQNQQQLRLLLDKIGPDRFWMLWDHHVVCDGQFTALGRLSGSYRETVQRKVIEIKAATEEIIKNDGPWASV